ncbi:MAG: molybdopterin molybdenumtransferase MoeA [Boseongicola sp.]|nr:MAG: molybdopterin molybdenumtransferase MoeA [Boseongicola sp.]
MISVREALDEIFKLVQPLGIENVNLRQANGRVLAKPVIATRNQPPFRTSVMDGYGIADLTVEPGQTFRVIGEAAAGHRFAGQVEKDQAIRIFTGAPVPETVNRVLIQEDVTRTEDMIEVSPNADSNMYIRLLGSDFKVNDALQAPRQLGASELSLAAAMNAPNVNVYKQPKVAILATGDELVMPGEVPNDDQIIASNAFGLAAIVEAAGGIPRILPIARDTDAALAAAFELALHSDLIVTIGGASVGDHDLVGKVAESMGMKRSFYKVAMRPGKPLMAGMIHGTPMIGLPGNPVSSIVCGHVFIKPALAAMQGLPAEPLATKHVMLSAPLKANGPREHYMRASLTGNKVQAAGRQDSGLLSVLSRSNALIVRAANDPERASGSMVDVVQL